jgi:hypothetical protein
MSTTSILTVITPAPSQDLVSLATVRAVLKDVPVSDNAFLNLAKTAASSAIATYCGRVFIRETVSELFRGRGPSFAFFGSGLYRGYLADGASFPHPGDPVALRRYPLASVASVTEDDVLLTVGVDYEVDAERGFLIRLWNDSERPCDFRKLVVQYTGGYAANAVPGGSMRMTSRAGSSRDARSLASACIVSPATATTLPPVRFSNSVNPTLRVNFSKAPPFTVTTISLSLWASAHPDLPGR